MVDLIIIEEQRERAKPDEVILDKKLVIEILKALEGVKRVLQAAIKT